MSGSDEDVCRVCRSEGTLIDPLFYPCKCSGSIRYVHQDWYCYPYQSCRVLICDSLMEWLSHSQKKHCELCKTPFQFTNLYDPAMPKRLPWAQMVRKLIMDVRIAIMVFMRWLLVTTVWLGWLPYCTRHIWRSTIRVGDQLSNNSAGHLHDLANMTITNTSISELGNVLSSTTGLNITSNSVDTFLPSSLAELTNSLLVNKIFTQILEGQIITSIIIIVFVIAFLIREWIVQNNAHLLDESPEFLGSTAIAADETRRQAMRLAAAPPNNVAEAAAEEAEYRAMVLEPAIAEAENLEAFQINHPSTLNSSREHITDTRTSGISDSSDWDSLKAQANRNRGRNQDNEIDHGKSPSENLIADVQAGVVKPTNSQETIDDENPTLTAAEQKALRRQATLQATSRRLRSYERHTAESLETLPVARRSRTTALDERLIAESGAQSTSELRHERARRRSAERKAWEQAERTNDMIYPDSPAPTPRLDSSLPEVVGDILPLASSAISDGSAESSGNLPNTLASAAISNDSIESPNTKSQAVAPSDDLTDYTSISNQLAGRDALPMSEQSVLISDVAMESLLARIRSAKTPRERTYAADAGIQICVDLAMAGRNGEAFDRSDPIYRQTIKHVGTIAKVANQYGVEGVVDVQKAFRLAEHRTAQIGTENEVETSAVAEPVIPIPEAVQEAQAVVDVAEANAIVQNDIDEDLDGLLELIGVRGPVLALVQNSMLVVVMVTSFIVFGICVPHMCGRCVLAILQNPRMYMLQLPLEIAKTVAIQFSNFARIVLHTARILLSPIQYEIRVFKYTHLMMKTLMVKLSHLQQATTSSKSYADMMINHTLILALFRMCRRYHSRISVALNISGFSYKLAHHKTSLPEQVLTVLSGYVALISLGVVYIKLNIRLTSGDSGKALELVVRSVLRQAGFVVKFVTILGIELILFPFYCGILIDAISSPFFPRSTLLERLSFMVDFPFTSIFLHWLIGTVYMFNFALFVSMCREIVRPGLLFFIRDPNDPAFNPIKDILERPVRNQMRKIGISILIYGGLITVASGTVVWALFRCLRGILPLRLNSAEPLFEIPFDLLLFQILLPLTYRYIKPHKLLKNLWTSWFHHCARALRLSSFIMGARNEDEEGGLTQRGPLLAQIWFKSPDIENPTFVRDGTFRRVPATDSLPMRTGKDMILLVNEDNVLQTATDEEDETRDDPNYTVVYAPPQLRLRIHLFLISMWAFAAILFLGSVVVPLMMGRQICSLLSSQASNHDLIAYLYGLYAFGLGCWLIGRLGRVMSLRHTMTNYYQAISQNPRQAATNVNHALILLAKWLYLLATLSVLVPVLLGLTLETYVVIPLGIWLNPAYVPTVHLVHDWIVGLVYVKIIGRTALMMPPNAVAVALNNTMRNDWRRGWRDPDLRVATKQLILPLTALLLAALVMPLSIGTLAKYAAYSDAPKEVTVLLYRMSYPAAFLSIILILVGRSIHMLILKWRLTVRDALYLKGRKLHNFGESAPPSLRAHVEAPSLSQNSVQAEIDGTRAVIDETQRILDNLIQSLEDEDEMAIRTRDNALGDVRPFDASQSGAGIRAKVILDRARQDQLNSGQNETAEEIHDVQVAVNDLARSSMDADVDA